MNWAEHHLIGHRNSCSYFWAVIIVVRIIWILILKTVLKMKKKAPIRRFHRANGKSQTKDIYLNIFFTISYLLVCIMILQQSQRAKTPRRAKLSQMHILRTCIITNTAYVKVEFSLVKCKHEILNFWVFKDICLFNQVKYIQDNMITLLSNKLLKVNYVMFAKKHTERWILTIANLAGRNVYLYW